MTLRPSSLNGRNSRVLVGCLVLLGISSATLAQAPVPPPVFPSIDERGVDIATGAFVHTQTDLVVGPQNGGGLAYTRYYQSAPTRFWTHNHNSYVYGTGTTCSVVLGTSTETFTDSASNCTGTFTSQQQSGSTLVRSGAVFTYTRSDGTIATFQALGSYTMVLNMTAGAVRGYVTSVTAPSGDKATFSYEWEYFCYPSPSSCWLIYQNGRLQTVSNNLGYRLWFNYPSSPVTMAQASRVTGINNAVEYCVPTSCANAWPFATYTYNSSGFTTGATNALGHATTYTYAAAGGYYTLLTEVQYPDHAGHDVNLTYTSGASGYFVSSVDLGFGTWNYAFYEASGQRQATLSGYGGSRTYTSFIASGRVSSLTNEVYKTISYQYDAANRQTKVTLPEGNYAEYTYDSRGNITQVRQVAKSGSGLSDIIASAAYPASCSDPRTCNKPTSTTDARGYRTDYTYSSTHGGVETITAPAPSGAAPIGSGDRPQTRVTYAQYQARYLLSASAWTNGTAVWRPAVESACSAGASCLGTANETRATITYPSSSTANNVLPISITTAAGDNSVSSTSQLTYTSWGDPSVIQGPLGSADVTRFYYDNLRRPIGVVAPDPDGGGPRLYRATRTIYNAVNQATVVERGTVTSQSDSALSSFVSLEKRDTVYDEYARPVQSRSWSGASIVALTEFSYNSRGLPLCTAVRMNPATFSSPLDACALQSAGSYGADRISRRSYDAVGRVSMVQSGYGTALAQNSATYTHTDNGQVATLTDARSYRTTYEFDGFDQLKKLRYPEPSATNQSSTSDYEELTYYSYGLLSQARRRSGELFTFSWDNLGRLTLRDAPGSQLDVSSSYDLLGRVTSTSQSGNALTTTYDALSRVSSVSSSVLGAVGYQYDAAGRRTRMDYPGGFYVTYGYNTTDLTTTLENGSTTLASYAYDDLGRRTSLTRGSSALVTSYGFDALSRLSTLTQDPSGSSYDTTFTLSYNASSQITSRTRTNGAFDWTLPASFSDSYAANGQNKYTNADGVTPSYDSRGNLTNDGSKTYGYDYDNRLDWGGSANLDYDPAGRLSEVSGATTTRFLYDGSDVIAEYDNSGNLLRRYVHGPNVDEPLAWYEGSGTNDRRYPMADERGSVIGIANSSGTVTSVNRYDAYGVPAPSNTGRFQYTGQMWLSDLGLYHYKARAYHPQLGRFMQTDPIGVAGGINLYEYGGGDPVNFTDPSGLCSQITATPSVRMWTSAIDGGGSMSGSYTDYTFECHFDIGSLVNLGSPDNFPSLGSYYVNENPGDDPGRTSQGNQTETLSTDDLRRIASLLNEPRACDMGDSMLAGGATAAAGGGMIAAAVFIHFVGFPEVEVVELSTAGAYGLLLLATGGETTLAMGATVASGAMLAAPVGVVGGALACGGR